MPNTHVVYTALDHYSVVLTLQHLSSPGLPESDCSSLYNIEHGFEPRRPVKHLMSAASVEELTRKSVRTGTGHAGAPCITKFEIELGFLDFSSATKHDGTGSKTESVGALPA